MINDILNKYLNNEKSGEVTGYSMDGITRLLNHLRNPHKNFKSLHIAGTNGKGSTAFMLSTILEKSGYKTGLYTSPHLITINERIKINSCDIDDSRLYKYISDIDCIVGNDKTLSPTYFDILTAAAFAYFSDESVDIAVIETGLGGRLDSTNVVTPEISIITDISMDHIHILGDKISDITKEKCGIIKPAIPVITSNTDPEIISIIEQYSSINESKLYLYNRDFFTQNIRRDNNHFVFDYSADDTILPDISLSLFPVHQVKNSSVVITALSCLKTNGFPAILYSTIYRELKKIQVPGRFQILRADPLIIYDPAHNYDSLKNLLNGLETYYSDKKKVFIFSMMKDKADAKTLELLTDLDVVYFLLDDERAYKPDNKFKLIISDENIIVDILQKVDDINSMIIFTGTFRIYNHAVRITKNFQKHDLNIRDKV